LIWKLFLFDVVSKSNDFSKVESCYVTPGGVTKQYCHTNGSEVTRFSMSKASPMWQILLPLPETQPLPRAKYRALGKSPLCRGPAQGAIGKDSPSAKKRPSAKKKTLPRTSLLALGKESLLRAYLMALGKEIFQNIFWDTKLNSNKKCSTTKLSNFLRSTKYILVISSFNKSIVMLFTKSTSL
jgi:hypothetical protein